MRPRATSGVGNFVRPGGPIVMLGLCDADTRVSVVRHGGQGCSPKKGVGRRLKQDLDKDYYTI